MSSRPVPTAARIAVLVAVVVALGAALLTRPATSSASSAPAAVATALERSPVYVDPAYDGVVSSALRRRLVRRVRALGSDVYVVLVPLIPGDQFGGEARAFVTALRSRMDVRDGTFLAAEDRYVRAFDYVGGDRQDEGAVSDAETLANYSDDGATKSFELTLVERLNRLLGFLPQSPARLAAAVREHYAKQKRERERKRKREGNGLGLAYRSGDDSGDGGGGGGALIVVLLVVLVAVAAGIAIVRRRRRGAHHADGPLPVVPDRVFEHARAAERAELHEDADRELLALAQLLDEQPVPTRESAQDAYQEALDAYGAARRRTGDEAPTLDLIGVLVLVDLARDRLARAATLEAGGRPPAHVPLCMFDPLHGRSVRTVKWARGLKVPSCAACAEDVRRGRTPDAVRDGDRPYFEGDSVWARTGFGALSDDLVARVARGED